MHVALYSFTAAAGISAPAPNLQVTGTAGSRHTQLTVTSNPPSGEPVVGDTIVDQCVESVQNILRRDVARHQCQSPVSTSEMF